MRFMRDNWAWIAAIVYSTVEKILVLEHPGGLDVHELSQPGFEGRPAPRTRPRKRGDRQTDSLGCRFTSRCRITFISNHSVHVARGFSCVECHGRVDQMDEVRHAKSLSMSFCLDCHRDPAGHIRPTDKVTDLGWNWSTNLTVAAQMQYTNGKKFVHDWRVESLQSCSACHR